MSMPAEGAVRGAPLALLRLEAAVLLRAAVLAYAWSGHSWWLFALGFLAPGLSMLACLAGPRSGAVVDNAAQTTLAPALLAGLGALAGASFAVPLAAIRAAHIGFDRLPGYGLKYGTGFARTHLGAQGERTP